MSELVPFEVTLVVVSVISFLLSVLLVYVNFRRGHGSIDRKLISLVSACDGLGDGYMVVSLLSRLVGNLPALSDGSPWCYTSVLMGRALMVAALDLTAMLAIVRYLAIVRGSKVNRKSLNWVILFLLVSVACVYGTRAITSVPRVLPSKMYCTFYWRPATATGKTLSTLIVLLATPPVILIPIFYYKITQHYRLIAQERIYHTSTLRQVRSLALIVSAYSLVILPEFIMSFAMLIFDFEPAPWMDAVVRILKGLSSIINALFALLIHTEIRLELKQALGFSKP